MIYAILSILSIIALGAIALALVFRSCLNDTQQTLTLVRQDRENLRSDILKVSKDLVAVAHAYKQSQGETLTATARVKALETQNNVYENERTAHAEQVSGLRNMLDLARAEAARRQEVIEQAREDFLQKAKLEEAHDDLVEALQKAELRIGEMSDVVYRSKLAKRADRARLQAQIDRLKKRKAPGRTKSTKSRSKA